MGIVPRWRSLSGVEQTPVPIRRARSWPPWGCRRRPMPRPGSRSRSFGAAGRPAHTRGDRRERGTNARIPLGRATEWQLELEAGDTLEGRDDGEIAQALPAGLHRLRVGDETCLVIAAPQRAPAVGEVAARGKAWGVSAALYGLRSKRNLGVGDYRDLADAAEQVARLGAISSASTRSTPVAPPVANSARTPRPAAVPWNRSTSPPTRCPGSSAAREPADSWRTMSPSGRQRRAAASWTTRRTGGGSGRSSKPCSARRSRQGGRPRPISRPGGKVRVARGSGSRCSSDRLRPRPGLARLARAAPGCPQPGGAALASENARSLRWHAWQQWLAGRQLAEARPRQERGDGLRALPRRGGGGAPRRRRGLVGSDLLRPERVARRAARRLQPRRPDLEPGAFSPGGLRAAAYRPFVRMLRAAMANAGIVRIDHVQGLQRSFWVPESGTPGGYVRYPLEALLALVRIEAARAGSIVVGEDLGSVPAGLRPRLAESGLLGSAVMEFEKEGQGFRPPRLYRPASLASTGTHDTPTLKGWWSGRDIELRHRLGRIATRSAPRRSPPARRSGRAVPPAGGGRAGPARPRPRRIAARGR